MNRTVNVLLWLLLLIIVGIVITNIAMGLIYAAPNLVSLNSTGIFFIILAFACFILEIFTTSLGLFTMGGIVSITIGSLILFNIQPWLIALIDVTIAGVSYFVIIKVMKAQQRKVTTGREEAIGKTVEVKEMLNPRGLVSLDGELWTAISDSGCIEPGEEVIIKQIDGIILHVVRKDEGGE